MTIAAATRNLRFSKAVALVLAVGLAGAACTTQEIDRPLPTRPEVLPEVPELEEASTVWPGAMFTVPAKVKGGPDIEPVGMLGEEEALVVAESFAGRSAFYAYDARTKRFRALATTPNWAACDQCFELRSVVVGESRIAFTVSVYRSEPWNAGKRHVELWAMPRSGGPMKLVTWLTGHGDLPHEDRLSIAGDEAVWEGASRGYRIPLNGGPAIPFRPAPRQTGPASAGDLHILECGAEWCVGLPGPRLYEVTKVVVLRKDGTQRKEVAASSGRSLMNDRFGLFWGPNVTTDQEQLYTAENPAPRMILYDRCAERSAQVGGLVADGSGPEISMGGASAADPEEPVLYWNSPDRKSWKMLDLARIPDGVCSD